MTLKELIRKRIEENVPDYDITKIERYEYLIEMIAIEHAGEVVKNISSKPVLCGDSKQLFCHTCKNKMPENEGGNCCSKCWNEKYGAK